MEPTSIDSVHARVGTTVRDKWVLGAVIGAGGTAAVYEATHRTNGKKVAVKVMHAFLASSEDVVARFQREGYIANKVGHPGAVAILDDDTTEDGAPFLVMDRLEGEPLARILEHASDGLAVGQVLGIAYEVLDILGAAHARGIVHRDIKPDNVFLTTSGRIMVLDFGIARLHERAQSPLPGGADLTQRNSARTQEGSALGTPQYMAPEQARGRWNEVDAQSDLWSVGAMMFRLLTGKPVRDPKGGASEMLLSAMTEEAPSVSSVAAVPPDVAAIVDKALAFDKKNRWPDARAMQSAVGDAVGRIEAPDSMRLASSLLPSSRASAPVAPPARKNRALVLLAAATFALAAAIVTMRPREETAAPPTAAPPLADEALAAAPSSVPATASITPTDDALVPVADVGDSGEASESKSTLHGGGALHHRRGRAPAPVAPAHPAETSSASPSSILDRRH